MTGSDAELTVGKYFTILTISELQNSFLNQGQTVTGPGRLLKQLIGNSGNYPWAHPYYCCIQDKANFKIMSVRPLYSSPSLSSPHPGTDWGRSTPVPTIKFHGIHKPAEMAFLGKNLEHWTQPSPPPPRPHSSLLYMWEERRGETLDGKQWNQ